MLVTAIYSKTIEISTTAIDNNAAVTLMSTDVERLILGLRGMHDLWANVLQFGLAAWLLQTRMGWASIGPFVVIFVAIIITGSLAGRANKLQLDWIGKIEKRVGITSNILGHMKGIKMLGLSKKLTEYVQNLRIHELNYAQRFRTVSAVTAGLAFAPNAFGPVATFAFYAVISARDGSTVDAPRLFTSLSLLILITQPLFAFFEDIVSFRTTFGCADRIETFLVAQTRLDNRLVSSVTTSREPEMVHDISSTTELPLGSTDIELSEISTFNRSGHMSTETVRIEEGAFGWDENAQSTVYDITCNIYRSEVTLLIGPVASGKTTLLKAILGETPSAKGVVSVSENEIAYCDQTPWLTVSSHSP
jgi:ABC-type multidrug transport system fused ATPase/permease subunit